MNTSASNGGPIEWRVPWSESDGSGRQAMLTELLAQVSVEALQGETLDAILQRVVDCIGRRLPVAIASIILLNDAGTHFEQEVWAGSVTLELPSDLPWPVGLGAAGRCVDTGEAQLIADVDCFKALNDARGHLYGDECLRALTQLCTEVANEVGAMAARYGGEEIVLLLSACDADDARRLGEHLRQRVQALALEHPGSPVAPHVTVSVGISIVRPGATQPPEMLIAMADRALYVAKARGRNRVVMAH